MNYVIPMFLGHVHIYVRPEIKTFEDLVGKKVGFNTVGSAANYTGGIVFDRLGIKVERVFQNNALALEAMRRGELAGIVHVVGKPNELFAKFKPEPGFHFLPVEFGAKFEDYYIPTELTSKDYPNLIPEGQSVPTISVSRAACGLQLEVGYGPLSPLRALRRVPVRSLREAQGTDLPAGLEGDEPGGHHPRLDALSAGAGDGQQGNGSQSKRRSGPCAPAGGARGAEQSGRAGTVVQSVPGMEQATEAAVTGSITGPAEHEGACVGALGERNAARRTRALVQRTCPCAAVGAVVVRVTRMPAAWPGGWCVVTVAAVAVMAAGPREWLPSAHAQQAQRPSVSGRLDCARGAGFPRAAARFKLALQARFQRTASFEFAACLRQRPSLKDMRSRPEPGPCPSSRCRR